MPKMCGRVNVGDAVDAAGEPALVAKHQEGQRGEGERDEGEVVVLHPQRRIAEHPADREAQRDRDDDRRRQRPAMRGHDRCRVSADADEGALRQRDLAGIAEREVEAHGGDRHHRPLAQDEQAIAVEVHGDDDQRGDDEEAERDLQRFGEGAHTVRSSARPSKPCGRNRMTAIRMIIGTAARYCVET
ncbi:hypothetical protein ACVWWR_003719 [Bradyrhizobium sp. LM3.2]